MILTITEISKSRVTRCENSKSRITRPIWVPSRVRENPFATPDFEIWILLKQIGHRGAVKNQSSKLPLSTTSEIYMLKLNRLR